MAFKLLPAAEETWRKLNGSELLPLLRARVRFEDGQCVEREVAKPQGRKGSQERSAA